MRKSVRARVRITLVPTEQGGRSTPVEPGLYSWRPDHDFGRPDGSLAIGEVDFDDNVSVMPGETREATATFISAAGLLEDIGEGFEWRIREGARHVGDGHILQIQQIREG